MMYDTFHANIEEKSPAEAIRTAAPQMALVHISENDRSTPGTGNIPWKATFDTLREVNYQGWMVVEAFGLALPAIVAATKDLAPHVPERGATRPRCASIHAPRSKRTLVKRS